MGGIKQSPESIIAYQSRLKIMIDEEARLDYAEHKGLEKGLEQGRGQGAENIKKEIIHSGIELGFDISALAKLTGYSEERVREIADEV